jgi:hypothetical protein
MAEDSRGPGGLIAGGLAVVAIAIVGYFLYNGLGGPANVPATTMSRDEAMKHAMPGTPEAPAADSPSKRLTTTSPSGGGS